jgi:hypothetical protein
MSAIIKPRIPFINWGNPLTKGLLFDVPFVERGGSNFFDTAGKLKGSLSGSGSSLDQHLYGNNVVFADNTNIIAFTTPAFPTNGVTIEGLVYPTASNAAGDARFIHKGDNIVKKFSVAYLTSGAFELATGFSTTEGDWDTPASFTANNWWHVVITYLFGDVATDPLMYVNGLSQTVTEVSTPVGTAVTDNTTLGVGNRSGGLTKAFVGKVAYTRYWGRILSPGEIKQLYQNPFAIYVPQRFYRPLNSVAAAVAAMGGNLPLLGVG